MNIARTWLTASALFAALAPARAAEAPLPLWEAGVFGGTAVTPAYPGASERSTRSLALPYLIYRGKVLRADRSGVGARLLYRLNDGGQAWHVDASIGAVLGNAAINDYFYGVSPAFATAQRPAYVAKSGLMLTRLGLGGSYRLQRDWRAFAFLRYDNYTGAANRASPLLRQNSGTSAGIGLMWTWRRSDSLARGPDEQ